MNNQASEQVQEQHATILRAIAYFQNELDRMTDEISPDTTSWSDVSKFAHVADWAAEVCNRFEEV